MFYAKLANGQNIQVHHKVTHAHLLHSLGYFCQGPVLYCISQFHYADLILLVLFQYVKHLTQDTVHHHLHGAADSLGSTLQHFQVGLCVTAHTEQDDMRCVTALLFLFISSPNSLPLLCCRDPEPAPYAPNCLRPAATKCF